MIKFLKKNKKYFLYIFIIISIFSFIDTISKGLVNGCDFQWHPSKIFWEGINHYQKFINQGHGDFKCQNGEYAHGLHVILLPYALLEWDLAKNLWVVSNIFFTGIILFILFKNVKISNYKKIILILIFITCYPTRMTINYGQQSLLVFLFLILPFFNKSIKSILLSGISVFKYSTGYIIFLYFLVEKKFRNFFIATIPYFIGWIIYFAYTKSNPIVNFFEPILLILKNGYTRSGDIYSFLTKNIIQNFNLDFYPKIFLIIFIFFLNYMFLLKLKKIKNNYLQMALICFCPLIFLPHSNYDYVLLFPLLIYSFSNYDILINKINFYFVIYVFYINRLVRHLINFDEVYQPFFLLIMIFIFFANIDSYNHRDKIIIFKKKIF